MAMTLYTFGPAFGLPDPSPFCIKAMTLMHMAGIDFEARTCDVRKAPKGKAPYLDDNGALVPDSRFIRRHLETAHGVDFDVGLSAEDKAVAEAFERMCEEHLYWAMVYERWMVEKNFAAGPAEFFNIVAAPMRGFVKTMVKRQIKRDLHGQGTSRHSRAEIIALARPSIEAIAVQLGDKDYLFGDTPCGADASVSATVMNLMVERFDTELVAMTRRHDNLVAYADRVLKRYYAS